MMTPFKRAVFVGIESLQMLRRGVTPIRRRSIVGEIIVAGPPHAILFKSRGAASGFRS